MSKGKLFQFVPFLPFFFFFGLVRAEDGDGAPSKMELFSGYCCCCCCAAAVGAKAPSVALFAAVWSIKIASFPYFRTWILLTSLMALIMPVLDYRYAPSRQHRIFSLDTASEPKIPDHTTLAFCVAPACAFCLPNTNVLHLPQ